MKLKTKYQQFSKEEKQKFLSTLIFHFTVSMRGVNEKTLNGSNRAALYIEIVNEFVHEISKELRFLLNCNAAKEGQDLIGFIKSQGDKHNFSNQVDWVLQKALEGYH